MAISADAWERVGAKMAVPPLGKHPGASRDPLGIFPVASKMGFAYKSRRLISGSQTSTASESLAMYRLGQARRMECEADTGDRYAIAVGAVAAGGATTEEIGHVL